MQSDGKCLRNISHTLVPLAALLLSIMLQKNILMKGLHNLCVLKALNNFTTLGSLRNDVYQTIFIAALIFVTEFLTAAHSLQYRSSQVTPFCPNAMTNNLNNS